MLLSALVLLSLTSAANTAEEPLEAVRAYTRAVMAAQDRIPQVRQTQTSQPAETDTPMPPECKAAISKFSKDPALRAAALELLRYPSSAFDAAVAKRLRPLFMDDAIGGCTESSLKSRAHGRYPDRGPSCTIS